MSERDRSSASRRLDLNELYGRHASWFRGRMVRRYGVDDAEDLVQETWLRLTPYWPTNEVRHPKALLLRVASNLAVDLFGRRDRRGKLAEEVANMDGWGVEMPRQSDELLAKQLVLGLPQPLRDVFVLSRISGLSNNQIAEQLGISPKTVEKRMTKAKAHCAAQLRL